MSLEDEIRIALDGATASLRQHAEADLRAFADELVRASTEERERVVAEATEERARHLAVAAHERERLVADAAQEREHLVAEAAQERERLVADAAQERERVVAAAAQERAQAVAAAAQSAAADVRAQADAQIAQFRGAAQKHAEDLKRAAEGQIGEARKALEDLRTQAQQQLDATRRIAQGEIEKARGEVVKAQEAIASARRETEKAHHDADKARGETETARAESEHARADARSARAESEQVLRAAKAETEKARADVRDAMDRAQSEIERMRKTAAAEAEEVVIARLSAAHADGERKIADAVERVHTDSHQSELSRAARLADAIRNLDEARGLSEVLERLVTCAGHEVDRAAVLLVKGERLSGWRLAGFGAGAPAAKSIDLSVNEAGLAGAVLGSGISASRSADASDGQPALPAFANGAGQRHAMALPVRVGGEVVAVLYADAPRLDAPSSAARWPAVLEVLVRHASRVLEAMTVQQAAGLSLSRPMPRGSHAAVPGPVEHVGTGDEDAARRYARLLLSEIRMYHEPVVDAGRRSRDLMSRLHGEIERARRLYEARVPPTVAARAEYFDQEMVRTLADGDRTLLGGAS